jgi:hypothetical protein
MSRRCGAAGRRLKNIPRVNLLAVASLFRHEDHVVFYVQAQCYRLRWEPIYAAVSLLFLVGVCHCVCVCGAAIV